MKKVCTVDVLHGNPDLYYYDCVLDQGRPFDCLHATSITSREQCKFWKAISQQHMQDDGRREELITDKVSRLEQENAELKARIHEISCDWQVLWAKLDAWENQTPACWVTKDQNGYPTIATAYESLVPEFEETGLILTPLYAKPKDMK